jgi:hypothetical protein
MFSVGVVGPRASDELQPKISFTLRGSYAAFPKIKKKSLKHNPPNVI